MINRAGSIPGGVPGHLAQTQTQTPTTAVGAAAGTAAANSGGTILFYYPSDITLSGRNLIATQNANSGFYRNALSQTTRGANKVYAEVQVTTASDVVHITVGIGSVLTNETLYLGSDNNSYGWFHDASFAFNGLLRPYVVPTYAVGDWLSIAVNRTAHTLLLRNITTNSLWSDVIDISALGSAEICAAAGSYTIGDVTTFNFDGTFLGYLPASDYTRWDGATTTTLAGSTGLAFGRGDAPAVATTPATGAATGTGAAVGARFKTWFEPATTSSLIALTNNNLTATKGALGAAAGTGAAAAVAQVSALGAAAGTGAAAGVSPSTAVTQDAVGLIAAMGFATTMDYTNMTVSSGATLLLFMIAGRAAIDEISSAVWDQGGTNQTMTRIVKVNTANSTPIFIYGLVSPTPGNKILRTTVNVGSFLYGLSAVSYFSTNTTLASAVPSGSIIQQHSSAAASSQTDSITVGTGQYGLILNHCENGYSNNASWSPTPNDSSGSMRMGFLSGTGSLSLTITPDIADFCVGVSCIIST